MKIGTRLPNPLETVTYSDSLESDSLAELYAILEAYRSREPEHLLVLVWPDRSGADEFIDRWRLSKSEKFYSAEQIRRNLGAQPKQSFSMGGGFQMGGGFAFSGESPKRPESGKRAANQGWLDRAKAENIRFRNATDSEYWLAVSFDSEEDLLALLEDFGLQDVPDLPGYGHRLSGPAVDKILEDR